MYHRNINNKYPRKASAAGGKKFLHENLSLPRISDEINGVDDDERSRALQFGAERAFSKMPLLALYDVRVHGWQISRETANSCIANFSTLADVPHIMQLNFLHLISKTSEEISEKSLRNILHAGDKLFNEM